MGCSACAYSYFCSTCAAGEVARYAGRDYCVSCFVWPVFFGPFAACCWACDRAAFVQRYNIADGRDCMSHCCLMCFCTVCALSQMLNHAMAAKIKQGSAMLSLQMTPVVMAAAAPATVTMAVTPASPQPASDYPQPATGYFQPAKSAPPPAY
jgi:hypothetical protein